MTTAAIAADSIEATTSLLETELPQLEKQQQALEEELAAVSERLDSVRRALTALTALSTTAIPKPRTAESDVHAGAEGEATPVEPAAETEPAPEPVAVDGTPVVDDAAAPQKAAAPRKTGEDTKKSAASKAGDTSATAGRPAKNSTTAKATKAKQTRGTAPAAAVQDAGGLTEQVIAVLARHADTPLRARDVAQSIGRDDTTGSINAVRSTLDRLVATSRAHRAGRGLYQFPAA
ncbi:hypothetical protein [Streptomyces sp. NPDC002133]|uniref:hypothetical protein n=1 Tax=Streptomyces sp. NPDC002133 TaxID=3154409 RepID=UPI00333286A3